MYLGIEIGGTKLQLGIGAGDGSALVAFERAGVDRTRGAGEILRNIERIALRLIAEHPVKAAGCGFGGPVDPARGRIVKSHHVEGWNDFPLAKWCGDTLGLPLALGNDADVAGLAEACFGAARGATPVLYVTVGTGIGGGLIVDRAIYRGHGTGAIELGHLRPGLLAAEPTETVESLAAGWAIAAAAQDRLTLPAAHHIDALKAGLRGRTPENVRQRLIEVEDEAAPHERDLLERADGRMERLSAKMVAEAAAGGNQIARDIFRHAVQALGWAIAQTVTLTAPEVVVIGGGVSLAGEELFFAPLRQEAARYVFPPLADSFRIVPAQLGEEVVIHGALALAASAAPAVTAPASPAPRGPRPAGSR